MFERVPSKLHSNNDERKFKDCQKPIAYGWIGSHLTDRAIKKKKKHFAKLITEVHKSKQWISMLTHWRACIILFRFPYERQFNMYLQVNSVIFLMEWHSRIAILCEFQRSSVRGETSRPQNSIDPPLWISSYDDTST